MAFGSLNFLSDDEIARVHETSLKILQEVGIRVFSERVQSLLAEKGAEVDVKQVVHENVRNVRAIATSDKEIELFRI